MQMTMMIEECLAICRTVPNPPEPPVAYNTYGAMCTEVELDILTGEFQIKRLDVLYDCGESMSPLIG
jgi:xanthine dehydrogenase molybdopterin-binding subunit B